MGSVGGVGETTTKAVHVLRGEDVANDEEAVAMKDLVSLAVLLLFEVQLGLDAAVRGVADGGDVLSPMSIGADDKPRHENSVRPTEG